MTTFPAQYVRRPRTQHGTRRFLGSLSSVSAIVLDSIEATRSIASAHSPDARRQVLDRFAAETTRDATRSAA